MIVRLDIAVGASACTHNCDVVVRRKQTVAMVCTQPESSNYTHREGISLHENRQRPLAVMLSKGAHTADLILTGLLRKTHLGELRNGIGLSCAITDIDAGGNIDVVYGALTIASTLQSIHADIFEGGSSCLTLGAAITESAAIYLQAPLQSAGIAMTSSVQIDTGRYRLLQDMDNDTLDTYDNMSLGDIDFIVT